MSFSYTEKKRVRRSFEKISSVMELPNLLATQIQSYDAFLQRYVDSDKRINAGLEQVLNSIFPIEMKSLTREHQPVYMVYLFRNQHSY